MSELEAIVTFPNIFISTAATNTVSFGFKYVSIYLFSLKKLETKRHIEQETKQLNIYLFIGVCYVKKTKQTTKQLILIEIDPSLSRIAKGLDFNLRALVCKL